MMFDLIRNKKHFLSLLMASLLLVCTNTYANTIDRAVSEYEKYGLQIVDLVNADNIDLDKIKALAMKQTEQSVYLVQEYQKKFPQGKKLLDLTLEQVAVLNNGKVQALGPVQNTPFKVIEQEWHDLGFTTKQDVGLDMEDEDNEHFTDPLHVALHPLMALRAAQEYLESKSNDMKEAIKNETMEGIEQAILVKEKLHE